MGTTTFCRTERTVARKNEDNSCLRRAMGVADGIAPEPGYMPAHQAKNRSGQETEASKKVEYANHWGLNQH